MSITGSGLKSATRRRERPTATSEQSKLPDGVNAPRREIRDAREVFAARVASYGDGDGGAASRKNDQTASAASMSWLRKPHLSRTNDAVSWSGLGQKWPA